MYGTLQVIDVSDIEHPRSVAWYTPENGGVHNVWQVADTLYMGAYDAGFQVFDISGELKGDLRAQRREIASLNTADMGGYVQNAAVHLGCRGESEGRARLRERLQQRTLGGPGESQEVQGAAGSVRRALAAAAALLSACGPAVQQSVADQPDRIAKTDPPARDYRFLVASEGNDEIALVRFGPARRPGRAQAQGRHQPHRARRPARHLRLTRRQVLLRHHRARHAQRRALEILGRDRRAARPRRAGALSGHGAGRAQRALRLGGELQPLRRDGAVLGVGGVHRPDARGEADPDLRDAARLPAVAGRQAALLGLHDGRCSWSRSTRTGWR